MLEREEARPFGPKAGGGMIISRTPFRISFFGGGTDYPTWYRQWGGSTLVTTIRRYCYITCRWLPPFFEHIHRIVWSKIELVHDVSQIQHPAVREVLRYLDIHQGIELHHDGDLPARTGLGSSSSFTVGLLHALYGLKGVMPSKMQLALDAIHVEQERLKEQVGSQDQVSTAFGGFNRIDFGREGSVHVSPILLEPQRLSHLQAHLMLVYTGLSRTASEIAAEQVKVTRSKYSALTAMHQMVDEAVRILQGREDLEAFGRLLDEGWRVKRSLTDRISNQKIDQIYEAACQAGALGGKLLGAGGGGFLLLFVRPQEQPAIRRVLRDLLHVPIEFDSGGSRIIFYDPDGQESTLTPKRTLVSPDPEVVQPLFT